MNKLLLTISLLLASATSYADSPFLKYEFGIEEKNVEYYVDLRVFPNSDISIEVRPIEQAEAQILVPDRVWTNLNPTLFQQLYGQAIGLSTAPLEESNSDFVCELNVPFAMQVNHLFIATPYDHNTENFADTLQVVKGPEGCWVKKSVSFQSAENDEIANDLKLKLHNWFQQSAALDKYINRK